MRHAHYANKTATSMGYGGAVTSVDPEASTVGLRCSGGRQRGRRGRRHGRRAGRDRALQLGHRRRWLLRALRRPHRQGRHHRRPRDRPAHDAARRVHRPEDRQALQLHPRAGHQRRLGRYAGSLATWDTRAEAVGAPEPGPGAAPAERLARRGFRSTRPSTCRPRRTQRFANFPATSRLFLPGGKPPAVGSIFATPPSPRPTG